MATRSELRRQEIEGLRRLLQRADDERRGIVSRLTEIAAESEQAELRADVIALRDELRR